MTATKPSKPGVKVLRRDAAEAERRLWTRLRRKQVADAKFRRQLPIGDSVADFGCIALKVVVELEDKANATPAERDHDQQRYDWFESLGWTVIRVSNDDVFNRLDDVVKFITRSLPAPSASPTPSLDEGQDEDSAPWLEKD